MMSSGELLTDEQVDFRYLVLMRSISNSILSTGIFYSMNSVLLGVGVMMI